MLLSGIITVVLLTICVGAEDPEIDLEINQNKVEIPSVKLISSNIIDLSDENIPPELEDWDTPPHLVRNYPYYFSGFDFEDHPIWISEFGKYDLRKVVEAGSKSMEQFDNFTKQAALRIYKSHKIRDPSNSQVCYIIDFEGLKLNQLTSVPTVSYMLKLAQEFGRALGRHTHVLVVVNANYVAETLINMVKPIFGGFFSSFEVYGTNRDRWLPRVLRHFPRDQLPEWYGGHKNFTPFKAYG